MHKFSILFLTFAAMALSGCLQDPVTRGGAGIVGGALIADALDTNVVAGAAIGGLLGAGSCAVPGPLGNCSRY